MPDHEPPRTYMTFQQYTTYEQSLKLKELGLSQERGSHIPEWQIAHGEAFDELQDKWITVDGANIDFPSFQAECHQAGMPHVRFHDLRHAYASIAIQAGGEGSLLAVAFVGFPKMDYTADHHKGARCIIEGTDPCH